MSSTRLVHEVRKLVGKNYGVGSDTTKKLLGNLRAIAIHMASQGLQSISHMKTKHVKCFFEHLTAKGLSPSTQSAYATAMRLIAKRIGKPNIVPLSNIGLGFIRKGRYQPLIKDPINSAHVRDELYRKARWAGLANDMQVAFGLRRKESLLSVETVVSDGQRCLTVLGAKGGRKRLVPIENSGQAEILSQVQEFVQTNRWTSLIPPDLSLSEGLRKYSNFAHRVGGTKKACANPHRNRHDRAQKMKAEGKSDEMISEIVGHLRHKAAKHYC
jgi:site-specific recombinase XerD